jgi:mono/diheme cytochrome c family protein
VRAAPSRSVADLPVDAISNANSSESPPCANARTFRAERLSAPSGSIETSDTAGHPKAHCRADVEREWQGVRRDRIADRGHRVQIGTDREHIIAGHTPKTFLGGDKIAQYLEGAYLQDWSAPDITNYARLGLGKWSKEDLVTYLKSGHNRVAAATSPMGEVVTPSTAHMTEPDLEAIASYLKSLPGKTSADSSLLAKDPAMVAGAAIYRDQCSACHGLDGKGLAELIPSIADSSMVRSDDPTTSIRIVLRGSPKRRNDGAAHGTRNALLWLATRR